MKKPKLIITTPVGELEWVDVQGRGSCFGKEYKAEDAKFTASIILTKEVFEAPMKDGESFKHKLDTFHKEHGKKGDPCYRPYVKRIYDEDGSGDYEEEETDSVVIRAKTNVFYSNSDKPVKITVTDKSGAPYPPNHFVETRIGNGSKGRLAISVCPYDFSGNKGTTAYLSGVQLAHHVKYTAGAKFDQIEGDTDATSVVSENGATAPITEEDLV